MEVFFAMWGELMVRKGAGALGVAMKAEESQEGTLKEWSKPAW